MSLRGKVIFVTGSSRGIGRATALEAAAEGADVVLHCSRSRQSAEAVRDMITAKGGRAGVVQGDWADPNQVTRAAEEAWKFFGRIDVLVNNAGISIKKLFLDTETDELEQLFGINVWGTYLCTMEVLKRMVAQRVEGRILTVTSINASRSGEGFSLYGGSKAWLEMMKEKKLWDNIIYFLKAVLPEAEKEGVQMALHPDDPPISPLMGIGRILTSAAAYRKIFDAVPSPASGVAFCQATFKLMEEDIKELSREWNRKNKLFFIHLRDVEGNKFRFRETFHDNGPTDMAEMLTHYASLGFQGPLRPDHSPAMFGEGDSSFSGGLSVGYEMQGKIFAAGYIRGICHARGIPLN